MKHSIDIELISKMYESGMTSCQIGEKVGVPARTITRYLQKAGVKLRNAGTPEISALKDKALLERLYLAEKKSTPQIAKEIGASVTRVNQWLDRHGIPTRSSGSEKGHKRTTEEARRKQIAWRRANYLGDKNPNWRGGTPFVDPDRNRYPAKMWTKAVKDRDGWKCRECNSTERLHAHHIKRWRDYPDLRYDVDNGITLCNDCHERAHGRGFKFRWNHERQKAHERTAPQG